MLIGIFQSNLSGLDMFMAILGFVLAIMIALVLHEWAHAFAACKSGDNTAKLMGRLSLNPAKHVEPIGLVMFLLVGIGWAKPVPVNPFNYRNFKWGNFFVSVAGVTVNLILGILASLMFYILWRFGDMANAGIVFLYMFFMYAMVINFSLMIFNLLPIFPLDGYNMLVSFTKPNNRYMKFVRDYSQVLLIVVLVVSMVTGGIFLLRDVLVDGFIGLWGLMF